MSVGIYIVKGIYTATNCVNTMSSSVNLVINPLPTAYNVTVTGGGVYCAGGVGDTIGLRNSQTGVNYQLYLAGSPVSGVGIVAGTTGSAIRFLPAQTIAGAYAVVATNPTTTCRNNMTGSASV